MKSWYWSVDNYRWLQASLYTCINRKCWWRTNFQFFQNFTFKVKRKCAALRSIALKSEDRWQIQRKPAEIISAESFVFKIGLPISRHNFTQSHSHCLMLTKTKIIKKIAGLAHVVFIRSLLFSLFLSRSTSCHDCESRMGPRVQVGLISC